MGRDERELPMMIESARIWETLEADIGESVGLTRGGCFFMAQSERELAELEAWLPIAHQHGLDTHIMSQSEIDKHVDGASKNWAGALVTPSDSRAEPHLAAPAIARAAERAGASILTGCAVRGSTP